MKYNKIIQFSLLLTIMSFSGYVYSKNQENVQKSVIIDEEGRTLLMNYVIQQEAEIAKLKLYAFNKFFPGMEYNSALYYLDLKGFVQEKLSSYYQAKEYKDLYAEIDITVNEIGRMIAQMGTDKSQLALQDMYGKTVLNYCYTKEVYNKLRAAGVPFQFDTWTYIYRNDLYDLAVLVYLSSAMSAANASAQAHNQMLHDFDTNNYTVNR